MAQLVRNTIILILVKVCLCGPAFAQAGFPAWRPIALDSSFVTGDSWISGGTTFRLYGVQACLRGSMVTGRSGETHDCGSLSMMMLVKLVQQWHPLCYPVYHSRDGSREFVICTASVAQRTDASVTVDLGTAMIASGFAFAALNADAHPVNQAYLVAQMMAKKQGRGLWSFPDLDDPNGEIMRHLAGSDPTRVPPPQR